MHLFAGIWGTLAVILTNDAATLTGQMTGIAAIGVFAFAGSLAVWMILKTLGGIRVSREAEISGLDVAELGMEAYPEFSKAS